MTTQATNLIIRLDTDNLFSKTGSTLSNLLKHIKCSSSNNYCINGSECELRARSRLAMLCPNAIINLIKDINVAGPKAVIAGGIVNLATDITLDIFSQHFNKSDIDIFVFGPDKQETVKRILSMFTYMVPPDMCINIMGPTYVGVRGSVVYIWSHGLSRLIQIVIMDEKHQTVEDVLNNFDMTHIMCAFDGTDFIVRGSMLETLATRTTIYTRNTPSAEIQGLRILKAETRNYDVLMTTKSKPDVKIPVKFDVKLHYVNNSLVQDYMTSSSITPWKVINGKPDAEIIDYYMKQSKLQKVVKCETDNLPDIIASIDFVGFSNMLSYTTGSSQPDKPNPNKLDNKLPSPISTPSKTADSTIPDYPTYDLSGEDEPSESIIHRTQDPEHSVFLKLSKKRWIYNPHMNNVRIAFTIRECDRLRILFPNIKLSGSFQHNEYIGELVNIKILYDWYNVLAKCTDPETDIYIKFPKKQLFTNQNHTVLEIDERAYNPANRLAESQESKLNEMRKTAYYMGTLGPYMPLNTNPETFRQQWTDSFLSESYEIRSYINKPSYDRTYLNYSKISTVHTERCTGIFSITKPSYKVMEYAATTFLHVELTDNEAANLEFIRQQMIAYARTMNIAPDHKGLNIHPVKSMTEYNDNIFEQDGKKYVKVLIGMNGDDTVRQELPLRFNNYGGKFCTFAPASFMEEFTNYSPPATLIY